MIMRIQTEIIRCCECRFLQEQSRGSLDSSVMVFGSIYRCGKGIIELPQLSDYCSKAEKLIDNSASGSLNNWN